MVDRSNLFFFLQVRNSSLDKFGRSALTSERRRVHVSIFSLPFLHSTMVAHLLTLSFCFEDRLRLLGLPLLVDDQPALFFTFFSTVATLLYLPRILGSPFKLVSTNPNPAAASSFQYNDKRSATSQLGSSHRALWLQFGTIIACGGGIE
jgi:hypothetical protein